MSRIVALTGLLALARAQCSVQNISPYCSFQNIAPSYDETIYFSSTDTNFLTFQAQAESDCSGADYGVNVVIADQNQQLIQYCGCLSTDLETHEVECDATVVGALPEGEYNFGINKYSTYTSFIPFTITHSQSTVYAAAQTTTITVTDAVVEPTVTTTITSTIRTQSAVVTVYVPESTIYETEIITPEAITMTVTDVATGTARKTVTMVQDKTVTHTAPCTTAKPHMKRLAMAANPNGDGPLTTTVTPQDVTVTVTTDEPITTMTVTDVVFTTTTEPVLRRPTVSLESGTLTSTDDIETLMPATDTVTVTSTSMTTETYTKSVTVDHTKTVTPTCSAKHTTTTTCKDKPKSTTTSCKDKSTLTTSCKDKATSTKHLTVVKPMGPPWVR